MKQKKHLDILEAISSQDNQNLLGTDLGAKLFRKYLILENFFRGKADFVRSFYSLLPDFLRPQKALSEWSDDLDIEIVFKKIFGECILSPVKLFGYKLHYLPREEITARERYLYFFGLIQLIKEVILKDQYCARQYIKDSFHIVDVGANIGIFSLFANHLSCNGMAYAFEPATKPFNFLQKTIGENNLSEHIRIFNKALGNKEGRAKLLTSSNMLETSSTIKDSDFAKGKEEIFHKSEEVLVSTLDNLIEAGTINQVDFLKIDAEGYEKQIISGAEKTIKRFTPTIACSAYHLRDDKIKIPKLIKSINPNYNHRFEKKAEEVLIFWANQ